MPWRPRRYVERQVHVCLQLYMLHGNPDNNGKSVTWEVMAATTGFKCSLCPLQDIPNVGTSRAQIDGSGIPRVPKGDCTCNVKIKQHGMLPTRQDSRPCLLLPDAGNACLATARLASLLATLVVWHSHDTMHVSRCTRLGWQ